MVEVAVMGAVDKLDSIACELVPGFSNLELVDTAVSRFGYNERKDGFVHDMGGVFGL